MLSGASLLVVGSGNSAVTLPSGAAKIKFEITDFHSNLNVNKNGRPQMFSI